MDWMETHHWIGVVIAALVCGTVVSVLLNRVTRVNGRATSRTWYWTIRSFPPGCVIGVVCFLAMVQPGEGDYDYATFTISPQRAKQGDEVVLRLVPGKHLSRPVDKVYFQCHLTRNKTNRFSLGEDDAPFDGWEVRAKTDRLEPGEYTVVAFAETPRGLHDFEATLTVDPAPEASKPKVATLTITPQRVTQGDPVVLRLRRGPDLRYRIIKVKFGCVERGKEHLTSYWPLGDDKDGADGWEVRAKTRNLVPDEYTAFAKIYTEYGNPNKVTAPFTVDPMRDDGGSSRGGASK